MGRALCAREHGHRREALPALDAIRLADWCVGRSRVKFGEPNTHVDGYVRESGTYDLDRRIWITLHRR